MYSFIHIKLGLSTHPTQESIVSSTASHSGSNNSVFRRLTCVIRLLSIRYARLWLWSARGSIRACSLSTDSSVDSAGWWHAVLKVPDWEMVNMMLCFQCAVGCWMFGFRCWQTMVAEGLQQNSAFLQVLWQCNKLVCLCWKVKPANTLTDTKRGWPSNLSLRVELIDWKKSVWELFMWLH